MNCIVIDDEYPARALLEKYISDIPYLRHVQSFKSPVEALSFLKSHPVDLMFLDIQMPGLTGTEFLRTLHHRPAAIFTTAFPDYALEGYELDVVDYLVKPISFERFIIATEKAYARTQTTSAETNDILTVKADYKTHRIKVNDIIYIEGAREYVTYHLKDQKLMSLESLKNLEKLLPTQFVRIHKSYIINKSYVTSTGSGVVGIAGRDLPIGKLYRADLKGLL